MRNQKLFPIFTVLFLIAASFSVIAQVATKEKPPQVEKIETKLNPYGFDYPMDIIDSQDAEKKLLKKYNSDKKNPEPLNNLATYYFWNAVHFDMLHLWGDEAKRDEYEKKVKRYSLAAIKYFKQYIKITKENSVAYSRLAQSLGLRMRNGGFFIILKHLGNFNSALNKALELNPKEFEALITRAYKTLYTPSFIKNRKKMALEQFSQMLKEFPNNHHVLKGMAITYYRLNDLDKALEYLDRTLKYAPMDLEANGLKKQYLAEKG